MASIEGVAASRCRRISKGVLARADLHSPTGTGASCEGGKGDNLVPAAFSQPLTWAFAGVVAALLLPWLRPRLWAQVSGSVAPNDFGDAVVDARGTEDQERREEQKKDHGLRGNSFVCFVPFVVKSRPAPEAR